MVEHVARFPALRDRSVFVGDPADVVDLPLGPGLPTRARLDARALRLHRLRDGGAARHGRPGGAAPSGSGTPRTTWCAWSASAARGSGAHLLRRVAASYDAGAARDPRPADGGRRRSADRPGEPRRARGGGGARLPARPRPAPRGVRRRRGAGRAEHDDGADRRRGRPFLYFPLGHHFEQQVHVRHRLDRHGAGRALDYADGRRRHASPRRWWQQLGRSPWTTCRCRPTAPPAPLSWWSRALI